MTWRDFYYLAKPWIPRKARVLLRRSLARARIGSLKENWMFAPGSEIPPHGWQGWPGGKKFAFILTHDVEGTLGVDRCLPLLELEQRLGVRSSFNFVPEGDYRVSPTLRQTIKDAGFEVGVHDLRHDGQLFLSREIFRRNALRINHYAKEWGARGFRAGFMLHELEWIKDLEIAYDASTFDVDPFEPQPDGVGTIFPFRVPRADGTSYIELPYTLLQDSTLFSILQHRDISLWKRKIDWVASRGGMVLVNVHPDYIHFGAGDPGFGEFEASHYEELIRYIQQRYAGEFWQPLPCEAAEHAARTLPDTHAQLRGSARMPEVVPSTNPHPSDPPAPALAPAAFHIPWAKLLTSRLAPLSSLTAKFLSWKHQESWPIRSSARFKPSQWPGWPDGKTTALVLLHDVPSLEALGTIPQVLEIERRYGFRSALFIHPHLFTAGQDTLRLLKRQGVELGILLGPQDDASNPAFSATLEALSREWEIKGARHLAGLPSPGQAAASGVSYDASGYDTSLEGPGSRNDTGSIFPHWISADDSTKGLIELPLTLPVPQLLERAGCSPLQAWIQKTNWLQAEGGLIALNTPITGAPSDSEWLADYETFLKYIAGDGVNQRWNPLPREAADYCATFKPLKPQRTGRRICMLAYSQVESDQRILRYAHALSEQGDDVDVLALGGEHAESRRGYFGPLWIDHLQDRVYDESGKLDYLVRTLRFTLRAFVTLSWGLLRRRYDLIHAHNIPDFLVFATVLPRLFGTKVILDIHDLVPEFYECKFHTQGVAEELIVEALRFVEKASANMADHVIIANHLWYEKITKRSVVPERCTPFINYIDLGHFRPRGRREPDGKFRLVFPGGLQWHQGLDIAIRAFKEFHAQCPNSEFHIYGHGNEKPALIALANELGLSKSVSFFPPVRGSQIPGLIAESDLGVVPKRADSFGNEAYSTKIMEFMSQRIPVIVSRTKVDLHYFKPTEVLFFESGNVEELTQAMLRLYRDADERERLVVAGLRYVQSNNWEVRKHDYLSLVNSLLGVAAPSLAKSGEERRAA